MPGSADIFTLDISLVSKRASRASLNTPLILGASTPLGSFPELIRYYSDIDGVADDWATTTPEYIAAAAIFAQEDHPSLIAIGRRTNKPTLRWAVTPTAQNSTKYALKFGTGAAPSLIEVTSDASATVAEIIALLKTAIDALSLPVTTSDQTTYLRILENTAGAWHRLALTDQMLSSGLLAVAQDNADAGIAADLDAIVAQPTGNDWYTLHLVFTGAAEVAAAAAWVETHGKLLVADSQDTAIVGSGSSDIASSLKALNYKRSPVWFHEDNGQFLGCALAGRVLTITPGNETWAYKTLVGVTASALTATQEANACGTSQTTFGKNANVYVRVGDDSLTKKGRSPSGQWVDLVRGIDDLGLEIGADARAYVLGQEEKVPFDDNGIAGFEAIIRKNLRKRQPRFIRADQEIVITVPKAAEVDSADRAARVLNGIEFEAGLTGAIHAANVKGRLIE